MAINKQLACLVLCVLCCDVTTSQLVPCPDDQDYFNCGEQAEQEQYQCIPSDQKCNGIAECYNGADESVVNCGCPGEFQCDNSTCINSNLRCNLHQDCDNGRDEEDCETYICPSTYYKCDNHYCIPSYLRCNFRDDCQDNSDEKACHRRACFSSEWKCDNQNCINSAYLCDGRDDCFDGSDEQNCSLHLQCTNGLYVADKQVCDGWVDCTDSITDELHCGLCQQNQYTCANSRCIDNGNVCDGICDCEPECDDENSCDLVCSKDKFICKNHVQQRQNRCLQTSSVCDGVNQCQDTAEGFDEEYCAQTPIQCEDVTEDMLGLCTWCVNSAQESCSDFLQHTCVNFINCSQPLNNCSSDEFMCTDGHCIPLTKKCDAVVNCEDMTDELDCDQWNCGPGQRRCDNGGQCVPADKWCDFYKDCIDSSDELHCDHPRECRGDEFQCNSGQCIPGNTTCYYLGPEERHLGCVDKSHLLHCVHFECAPGYLKCRNSYCVPESFRCNYNFECITFTDEEGCEFPCLDPDLGCICKDKEMFCEDRALTSVPNTSNEDGLTIYHLGRNQIGENLTKTSLLGEHAKVALLNLTNNSIQALVSGTFQAMFRLQTLILSDNQITELQNGTFEGLIGLKSLILYGNNIRNIEPGTFIGLNSLTNLNLSYQDIRTLQKDTFRGLKLLYTLTLDHNFLEHIENGAFNDLSLLKKLDLSHNSAHLVIKEYVFNGLLLLHELSTDQFRFCCLAPAVEVCTPKPDEFSSCEDLMSNIFLRISIWILGIISLLGNALVIMWRVYDKRDSKVHSFLISHLAVADMMMGVYLLIIASVDSYYRGIYIAYDIGWRTSQLCHFAGFLSTFSSELSVLTLTVITLDRFVTIIFPFQFNRMGIGCARLVMASMWGLSVFVSALPLCGIPYFLDFYSRSGVCLALHITNDRPHGWEYSVFVFLVLNLVSFLVIFIAYVWIFIVANETRSAVRRDEVQCRSDMAMARRMTWIVSTDFFCWIPIILLGFSSLGGAKIPPEVYAWVAVFVLPFNSAINPILYTISTTTFLKQARRRATKFRKSFISSLAPVPETHVSLASDERISLQDRPPKIYNRITSFEDLGSHSYSRGSKSISNNDYRQLLARNTNKQKKANGSTNICSKHTQMFKDKV